MTIDKNSIETQAGRPGLLAIAGGSFDNPDWYRIEAHIWTRSARSDIQYPEGMHVCEEVLLD